MKKILIVDYDQSSLASLQGTLAGQGYQVVTATDGQAGWDKYNKEYPDLVLMEAMLPKVHGFELCQRITSEPNAQVRVFIMTGVYKDRVYRTEALRTYGAAEYFEKPLKMAELLASVEAVLGKPEPPPAEAPFAAPAAPVPAASGPVRPAPPAPPGPSALAGSSATTRSAGPTELAEERKREKAKSDDSMFALPEDLDRLAREIPKLRKPAPAVPAPSAERRLDSLADDLLKSVITEVKTPKPAGAKPDPGNGNGNGNGNGKAEIDQFIASALAGFDLNKEKVRVPKTAPLPPPPPPAPVEEKPVPAPPPVAAKPKPAPVPPAFATPSTPPAREAAAPRPAAPSDMKNTLTPGDPGSDVSPFFTPGKPTPAPPVMRPVAPASTTTGSPAPAPALRTAKPVEKPVKAAVPAADAARPVQPASATTGSAATTGTPKPEHRPEPKAEAKPQQTPLEIARKDIHPTVGGDIFQDFDRTEEKAARGFPKIIPIAVGVVALAAVGFILLRPKRPAPARPRQTAQVQLQNEKPVQPSQLAGPSGASGANEPSGTIGSPETSGTSVKTDPPAAPKSEPKPAPVKQKAQPKVKPADATPTGVEAILPILPSSSELDPPAGRSGAAANAAQTEANQVKTEDPAAKPATETAAPNAGGSAPGADPAASNAEPTPIVPPVNEGDLVELSSVTELPKLLKSAEPVYPPTAQRLGVGGSVTVNALIDEKGNVIDTGILKGIQDDKGLGRAAETAVRKWKFQPARKNGVAVKVWKSFVIAFKADQNPANRME